jgi:cytidine deaminase
MNMKPTPAQKKLIAKAIQARKKAYAPFSGYTVGAALETVGGKVYTGCNVECDSSACCAERVALFKAVSDGCKKFRRIAVVCSGSEPSSPCGICRQALVEFVDDIEIIMATPRGKMRVARLKDLLPMPFHSLR